MFDDPFWVLLSTLITILSFPAYILTLTRLSYTDKGKKTEDKKSCLLIFCFHSFGINNKKRQRALAALNAVHINTCHFAMQLLCSSYIYMHTRTKKNVGDKKTMMEGANFKARMENQLFWSTILCLSSLSLFSTTVRPTNGERLF